MGIARDASPRRENHTELAAPTRDGGAAKMEVSLGKLLKFEKRDRPQKSGQSLSGDAQIFLFTGVRYERGPTPPPTDRLDPSRRRRKRG